MTPADLSAKYDKRFASNDTFNISAADLREFKDDLLLVFGVAAENVPAYVPGTTYTIGFLVRHTPVGGQEAFYYALTAGKLSAPGLNTTDWKVVPGPVAATALSQEITLLQAQGLDQTSVVAGREYLIDFGQDINGNTQTITLRGVSNNSFDVEGTLEVNGVRTAVTAVDVQAGTWQAKQYGAPGASYTDADAVAAVTAALVAGNAQHVGIQFASQNGQVVASVATQTQHELVMFNQAAGAGNLVQGYFYVRPGFLGYYGLSTANNVASIEIFRSSNNADDYNGPPSAWPSAGLLLRETEYVLTLTPLNVNVATELVLYKL